MGRVPSSVDCSGRPRAENGRGQSRTVTVTPKAASVAAASTAAERRATGYA